MQSKLKIYGNELIPYDLYEAATGEGAEFDQKKMLPLLLKTYSIDNIAENESLHIALTTDGAKITNNLNHSIVGLKMIDRRCKDLITKKYCSPQSRNAC